MLRSITNGRRNQGAIAEISVATSAFRFILFSGVGWLIDTAIYTILVALGLRVMVASIIGGLCGATFAFTTSHRLIFIGDGDRIPVKLVGYLVYSAALILAAGWIVERVTLILVDLIRLWGVDAPLATLAFVAKCLITPLLLTMNFVTTRRMLSRPITSDG
jgi:putative flippase GtrA